MPNRSEIENLLARYAWAFDQDEMGVFGACFAPDAEFAFAGETWKGRDEIRERCAENRTRWRVRGQQPRHLVTNVEIEEATDDRATVRSYIMVMAVDGEGATTSSIGRYHDVLTRADGEWRIQHREAYAD
jgi:uncharacterized protein (TIGR02246 family)